MPRVHITADLLKFDSKGYSKDLHAAISLQMKRAALAFVRAALLRIPVDTGMAAGSFLHLGRYLKRIGLDDAGVQAYVNANRKSPTGKYYHRPGKKGAPIDKDEYTPGNYGLVPRPASLSFQKKRNQHLFNFESKVFHLTLNDLGLAGEGWGAFEAGRSAFLAEMRNLRSAIPSIKGHVTKSTITLGRSGLTRTPPVRLRKQETVT